MTTRTLDEHTVRAVEALIMSREGLNQAIRGREIVAILTASGRPIHLRRVSESVKELRRRSRPILSTSGLPRGYYTPKSDDERARFARMMRAKIREELDSLRLVDAACAARLQGALDVGGAA